jgi:hypothetical protein
MNRIVRTFPGMSAPLHPVERSLWRVRIRGPTLSLVCGLLVAGSMAPPVGSQPAHSPVFSEGPCAWPPTTSGWMLFDDSSRRVPDFWWEDSLEVEQICACEHGIHFVFEVEERQNPHLAALVFPKPTPDLVENRLHLQPDGARHERELMRLREKYAALLRGLKGMFPDLLEQPGRLDFRRVDPVDHPWILAPSRKLTLRWNGGEIELRGYLDVYLALLV